jgi:hypothetical protein
MSVKTSRGNAVRVARTGELAHRLVDRLVGQLKAAEVHRHAEGRS